jgi:ABC-2 type transport system ATP-binding protein
MLQLENVVKKFKKVRAVDKLSFEIKPGEIFALLGPNGAGKTTTVRMIMQIIHPDEGSIHFDSSLMKGNKVDRTRIGYLPEERGLYQDTPILKTLVYLASLRGTNPVAARKDAEEWLKRLELFDRRDEKISALSKGNQQKVQFIASILHRPGFIIVDEPFSGFDPINQELICELLLELRDNGTTILLSAHQMNLVERIADRIMLINQGRELVSGTLSEIRKSLISDQKLHVKFNEKVESGSFENIPQILRAEKGENGEWILFRQEGAELNRLLEELSKAGSIHDIRTQDVSLHEIFVHSFNANGKNAS